MVDKIGCWFGFKKSKVRLDKHSLAKKWYLWMWTENLWPKMLTKMNETAIWLPCGTEFSTKWTKSLEPYWKKAKWDVKFTMFWVKIYRWHEWRIFYHWTKPKVCLRLWWNQVMIKITKSKNFLIKVPILKSICTEKSTLFV